ncbi:hypothetical protein Tco_0903048 [Tanacetum coccineum]
MEGLIFSVLVGVGVFAFEHLHSNSIAIQIRLTFGEACTNIEYEISENYVEDPKSVLERDVLNRKIKTAVWGCGTDKSPSPEGVMRNWIQSCLTSSKGSILSMDVPTNEFFSISIKGLNKASFIPFLLSPRDGEPSVIFQRISVTLSISKFLLRCFNLESIDVNFFNGHDQGSKKDVMLFQGIGDTVWSAPPSIPRGVSCKSIRQLGRIGSFVTIVPIG